MKMLLVLLSFVVSSLAYGQSTPGVSGYSAPTNGAAPTDAVCANFGFDNQNPSDGSVDYHCIGGEGLTGSIIFRIENGGNKFHGAVTLDDMACGTDYITYVNGSPDSLVRNADGSYTWTSTKKPYEVDVFYLQTSGRFPFSAGYQSGLGVLSGSGRAKAADMTILDWASCVSA